MLPCASSSADQLQVRYRQQRQREEDQDHAQHDRAGRSPQDALGALLVRQLAASERDDHRVVAAQQDVDHDDLADGDPELGGHELFHGRGSSCRRYWASDRSVGGSRARSRAWNYASEEGRPRAALVGIMARPGARIRSAP
jgi:hypothetical protein